MIGRKYKRKKKTYKIQLKTITKMPIETNISIITLNENGLNISTKRHGMAEWIKKKNKTHIYAVYKRTTSDLETRTDRK